MELRFTRKGARLERKGCSLRGQAGVLVLLLAFSGSAARMFGAPPAHAALKRGREQADSLLKAKHYRKALRLFKHLNAQRGKSSAACYWGMAQAYWGLGNFSKAAELCNYVFEYAGRDVRLKVLAHNLKGAAAHQRAIAGDRRRFKEAEGEFQTAYKLDKGYPDRAGILINLGITQLQEGETAQGIATLKDYLAQDPQGRRAERVRRVIADPRLASAAAAPEFSLQALDGQTYSLVQLRGKIILLDFWATWCAPCRDSVSSLAHLAKKFSGSPFVLISVSSDADAKAWQKFIQKNQMQWPQYLDQKHRMTHLYGVHVFPTYVVIDQDGIIVLRQSGSSGRIEMKIVKMIEKELATLAKKTTQTSKL